MVPELGQLALVLALALGLVQAIFPLWGSLNHTPAWMAMARPLAWGQLLFLTLAFISLILAFLHNDFSVLYVAQNSNTTLPTIYKISAVWGAHEGSMLLWVWLLSVWGAAVASLQRSLSTAMLARMLALLSIVTVGFLSFLLFTSNPFQRLWPIPIDGRDLNPLLQDPGLAIHPPMLYMGYVGFSVAWSATIAALIGGKLDATWARWTRPWTLVAWIFLTIGIVLGSWWAYYELGWGGFWFWDPVENASLMPWLIGTALIHSLAVTEKRGALKNWSVLLALSAFSLSLLGTFLVRSGILTSVHAFATDPTRGLFILLFLAVVIGGSLVLYAWRAPSIELGGRFDLLSRETFLLGNNLLLTVLTGLVLFGTLAPLLYDAMQWGKISVGFPWFNTMFAVTTPALGILTGLGPLTRWKHHSSQELAIKLMPSMIPTVTTLIVAVWLAMPIYVAIGLALTVWLALSHITILAMRCRLQQPQLILQVGGVGGSPTSPRHCPGVGPSFFGMWLAHIGVAVFVVGITMVSHYSIERDLRMSPGDSYEIAGYTFRFEGTKDLQGANYQAQQGRFLVSHNGSTVVDDLLPEKRTYQGRGMPMTEAAISPNLTHDLYISLGEPIAEDIGSTPTPPINKPGMWSVRIHYKPYVRWIWLGGLLMAIGGLIAACDRRYRLQPTAAMRLT